MTPRAGQCHRGPHSPAHALVDSFKETAPAGRANLNASPEYVRQVLRELREDMASSDPRVFSSDLATRGRPAIAPSHSFYPVAGASSLGQESFRRADGAHY